MNAALQSPEKITNFPQEAIKRNRMVDPVVADFLGKVNSQMRSLTGISYTEIMHSLHGDDLQMVRSFIDGGLSSEELVVMTVESHGLAYGFGDLSIEQATQFNRTKSAIAEFAAEDDEWFFGMRGFVYSPMISEDGEMQGIAVLQPVLENETGRFGFGIMIYEGATLDQDVAGVTGDRLPTAKYAGFDLDQPLERYRSYLMSKDAELSLSV